ncbi:MAG TPA: YjjI family glycine radical enzyme [Kineosporiaceae bacterium]|nr:YjjI family glycine radical enzyme [Kineosporiaceae bacterium]
MSRAHLQELVRACLADPSLTYRQRVQQLAGIAENALEPPAVGEKCLLLQDKGVVHDMGEGNAPYRPRYVLPDYAKVIRHGSARLELPAPQDFDDALTVLLATYGSVPSITGYPVYLGDLDTLLEPFAAGLPDAELDARLRRFWRLTDRLLPDAFVHANLGPADSRIGRAVLRVDRELRQVVPNLTLRVDPALTPDELLREAVLTACRDGKPHFVNHPMMVRDLGLDYGIVSCYNSLPRGGGAHTLCRLNLRESVVQHVAEHPGGGLQAYLDVTLPEHVAATAELMASRIRFLVEESGFYRHDWLVAEGLIDPDRFTAMFGLYGVAEGAHLLLEQSGSQARYGHDAEADELVHRLVARIAELVAAQPMPYCTVSGGRALLHAQSGIDSDIGITAGARVPVGTEPQLYQHIRAVAPHHACFPAGISDVFKFEPTIADNPDSVVAVIRGAFAEGMRDYTFDVDGNGFVRITGYLVRVSEVEQVNLGNCVRHSSTVLGAGAMTNQHLADRVRKTT